MDEEVKTELKEIKQQLEEINKKLDYLEYLSKLEELDEIASAIRRLSPEPQRRHRLPSPK